MKRKMILVIAFSLTAVLLLGACGTVGKDAAKQEPAAEKAASEKTEEAPAAQEETEKPAEAVAAEDVAAEEAAPEEPGEENTGNAAEPEYEAPAEEAPAEETPAEEAQEENAEEAEVGMPNPFIDCDSLEEAQEIAGFPMMAPASMDGYPVSKIQAIENEMIQIFYYASESSETEHVLLRKGVGTDDISGDYNTYEVNEEISINGRQVTARGDGTLTHSAIWNDGENAYAIFSEDGITEDELYFLVRAVE